MKKLVKILSLGLIALVIWTCSLWEYDDPSVPYQGSIPETYLTIVASDTLFPVSVTDTTWVYIVGEDSIPSFSPDTLTGALSTLSTSRQDLHWWGEDRDGEVVGYKYKWNTDPDWTYTTEESKIFFVPIRTAMDVFFFEIRAIDDGAKWDYELPVRSNIDSEYFSDTGDSLNIFDNLDIVISEGNTPGIQTLVGTDLYRLTGNELYLLPPTDETNATDLTPARLVFPVENSAPQISFRYQSNPTREEVQLFGDTSFTFPTRTFIWDLYDLDGLETVTDIYYTLDDTCDTCWSTIDAASASSITLTNLDVGVHTIYFKAMDVAGAFSSTISFPDINNEEDPKFWKVNPIVGETLLIDDFSQDQDNVTNAWYRSVIDSVVGADSYTVWEIGERLPFSATDVLANLKYFKNVMWYTAYTGNETYHEASSSIFSYLNGGGNLFMCTTELRDTSFVWFPIKEAYVINPSGLLWSGTTLQSSISTDYDIDITSFIFVRAKAIVPDSSQFTEVHELYHLPEPTVFDEWTGTPTMASLGRFQASVTQLSGWVALMTLPLHDGWSPTVDNKDFIRFTNYLFKDVFNQ